MEYVDGQPLSRLKAEQPQRCLAWDYLKPLVKQLCDALDYAHGEHVIHRDLKPANLMVDGRGRLKLADFGLAVVVNDSLNRLSQNRSTSGTPAYMSPQQIEGRTPQVTDDIYALGATLYELLASKPPFYTGDVLHQARHSAPDPLEQRLAAWGLRNEIPADVGALVMASLSKELERRPQSVKAVAEWINLELETGRKSANHLLQTTSEDHQELSHIREPGGGERGEIGAEVKETVGRWSSWAALALVLLGLGIAAALWERWIPRWWEPRAATESASPAAINVTRHSETATNNGDVRAVVSNGTQRTMIPANEVNSQVVASNMVNGGKSGLLAANAPDGMVYIPSGPFQMGEDRKSVV